MVPRVSYRYCRCCGYYHRHPLWQTSSWDNVLFVRRCQKAKYVPGSSWMVSAIVLVVSSSASGCLVLLATAAANDSAACWRGTDAFYSHPFSSASDFLLRIKTEEELVKEEWEGKNVSPQENQAKTIRLKTTGRETCIGDENPSRCWGKRTFFPSK